MVLLVFVYLTIVNSINSMKEQLQTKELPQQLFELCAFLSKQGKVKGGYFYSFSDGNTLSVSEVEKDTSYDAIYSKPNGKMYKLNACKEQIEVLADEFDLVDISKIKGLTDASTTYTANTSFFKFNITTLQNFKKILERQVSIIDNQEF